MLIAVVAVFAYHSNRVRGAGQLVVVEDVSSLGSGSFSGSVCFQVTRDSDGAVISESCVDAPTTFATPDGLEIGVSYSISISLSDPNCELLDDSRVSDGSVPFSVRVSCDPAYMTATAAAQPTSTPTPLPTDTPTPIPTPTSTSSPAPTPTPSPADTPESEPTPTIVPTISVTPTSETGTATPLPEPTPSVPASSDEMTGTSGQTSPLVSPQVVDVQLSSQPGENGTQRVQGAVTIAYDIAQYPGATVSVLLSISNIDTGGTTIVPRDVALVHVGTPEPANDAASIGSCVPIVDRAMPVALDFAVPVVSCPETGGGEGEFQQELTLEFIAASGESLDSYTGSISLTMAIAP